MFPNIVSIYPKVDHSSFKSILKDSTYTDPLKSHRTILMSSPKTCGQLTKQKLVWEVGQEIDTSYNYEYCYGQYMLLK